MCSNRKHKRHKADEVWPTPEPQRRTEILLLSDSAARSARNEWVGGGERTKGDSFLISAD